MRKIVHQLEMLVARHSLRLCPFLGEITAKTMREQVSGQIPFHSMLKFFYAIGEPLGHFGDRENTGRFLCVREELKRKLQDEAEATEVVGGWFYRNVFLGMKEYQDSLVRQNEAPWMEAFQRVTKVRSGSACILCLPLST